jgi:hypothetical protein
MLTGGCVTALVLLWALIALTVHITSKQLEINTDRRLRDSSCATVGTHSPHHTHHIYKVKNIC